MRKDNTNHYRRQRVLLLIQSFGGMRGEKKRLQLLGLGDSFNPDFSANLPYNTVSAFNTLALGDERGVYG